MRTRSPTRRRSLPGILYYLVLKRLSRECGRGYQHVRLEESEAPDHASARSIPSFTAFRSFCLQPRYRSVVWTET